MSSDTRFSSAIHFLILVSEADEPVSSAAIAKSIGTNPSYVRKLAANLKRANLIESRKGVTGFSLCKPASEITFLDIARASMGADAVHMFEIHRNPNDRCIVGHYIQPVLSGIFEQLDESAENLLRSRTLEDCISQMKQEIEQNGIPDHQDMEGISYSDLL